MHSNTLLFQSSSIYLADCAPLFYSDAAGEEEPNQSEKNALRHSQFSVVVVVGASLGRNSNGTKPEVGEPVFTGGLARVLALFFLQHEEWLPPKFLPVPRVATHPRTKPSLHYYLI